MTDLFRTEIVAGIDEVGRGPLAGPVVTAAVILPTAIEGLADSKALSEKRREALFPVIMDPKIFALAMLAAIAATLLAALLPALRAARTNPVEVINEG